MPSKRCPARIPTCSSLPPTITSAASTAVLAALVIVGGKHEHVGLLAALVIVGGKHEHVGMRAGHCLDGIFFSSQEPDLFDVFGVINGQMTYRDLFLKTSRC